MTDITAHRHCFHFVHKQVKQKGPDGRGLFALAYLSYAQLNRPKATPA
jgi:hypothetical protein